MRTYPLRRSRLGFGLLEMILVFAVVLGASAVVFSVAQSASASSNANEETQLLNTLVGNLRQTVGLGHNYQALGSAYSTASAFNNPTGVALMKRVYTVTGNVAKSPTGMTVTVNNWRDSFTIPGAADNSYYLVTLSNVPVAMCPQFLTALIGNGTNFAGVATTWPGSSQYSWIALQNKQAAHNMGYNTNMLQPSPSNYVGVCDFLYEYHGGIAVMVVGT